MQEIHRPDLNPDNRESGTPLQVPDQFGPAARQDKVYTVIENQLAGDVADPSVVLGHAYEHDKDQVRDHQLGVAERHGQRIDDREGDEHEQIGHLTYGHRLGTVAYDAENGEKPQGKSDFELDTSQQEYQEKDAHADEHEREVVVPAPALGIIKEMDDTPRDKGVEREAQQQLPHINHVHQRYIHKF